MLWMRVLAGVFHIWFCGLTGTTKYTVLERFSVNYNIQRIRVYKIPQKLYPQSIRHFLKTRFTVLEQDGYCLTKEVI